MNRHVNPPDFVMEAHQKGQTIV